MFRFFISKNCKFYIKLNLSGATHSIGIARLHGGLIIASKLEFLGNLFWVYNERNKTV